MTSDPLQPLFEHFRLHGKTFFTGNLCAVASFDQPRDHGQLHLVRSGRGEVRYLGGRKALKILRPGPEGPEGLDLVWLGSSTALSRAFRGLTGKSPRAWLQNLRAVLDNA